MLKLKRTYCYIAHWWRLRRVKCFGWYGLWCPKCGYTHFQEWDEDFADIIPK